MRVRIFTKILILVLVFIVVGLFYTQVIMFPKYKKMSEENRLRVLPLKAPRGNILDHKGRPLAKDAISFNIAIVYSHVKDKEALAEVLSEILEKDKSKLLGDIDGFRYRAFTPMPIAKNIGPKAAIQVEEIMGDYPGVFVEVDTKREYFETKASSHLLGYLGLMDRAEYSKLKHYGYRINDLVGQSGLEKQYDNYLRGKDGGKQVEVDNLGREISVIGYLEPVKGKDILTSIDIDLQGYCFELQKNRKGAIVVMNSASGAVLAMASSPSFYPGTFSDRNDPDEIRRLLKDKTYPLLNRAIRGSYPPGSVFKVIVATTGLEEGKISTETEVTCEGVFKLGRFKFKCWKERGHGVQRLTDAIKNSCNVYFYTNGLKIGEKNITRYAKKFGLGESTGIDIPGESKGFVPNPKWKKRRFKEQWYKGDTVNYSIGQGYLLVTPLQMARAMAVFANKGYLVSPYIVPAIEGVQIRNANKVNLNISDYAIRVIREGLRRCVNDIRGTGSNAQHEDVIISGKTGTSQTSRGKNHGWFAGFAPFEGEGIVVVVFDEFGGKGGHYAAATAGKVFRKAIELGLI